MEPEPGRYDFTWLDSVIEELGNAGIRTIVGTPTACPPAWMVEQKYGDIQTFNRRSGAIFWSQEYTGFTQIHPPVNAIEPGAQTQIRDFYENPTVRLEFERFSSECQIEFQNIQADILKAHTSYPVTTNGTGLATNSIDYYKGFENLDRYAFDYYPNLRDAWVDSFPYAFGRGVKPGAPFWVLEFMSGAVSYTHLRASVTPM